MKTSFIIGWFFLFILGWGLSMMVTGDTSTSSGSANVTQAIGGLVDPHFTVESTLGAGFIGQTVNFIKFLFMALALWFPALWTGYSLWFYYFVCVPVVIGFVFSIFSIARGVPSR